MTLLLVLAVCAGGGAGAACQYGVGRGVRPRDPGAFPLGVVLVSYQRSGTPARRPWRSVWYRCRHGHACA